MKADRVVRSTCPYCGVGCQIDLNVKDDRIFRVDAPFDAAPNYGRLCVKGRFGTDFVHHPSRLTAPLIRRTPQTPGRRTAATSPDEWREASWDEALDLVATRLLDLRDRYGPDSITANASAKATNEDSYLLQKYLRAVIGTNNVDHCARLCHAGSVAGLQLAIGSTAMSNAIAEMPDLECFMVIGSNTTETHPVIATFLKQAVRKHGARLIVVDPRQTEMTRFAELWLREKPGTDTALFNAMAQVIVAEKLYDEAFVAARTEGFDGIRRRPGREDAGVGRGDHRRAGRRHPPRRAHLCRGEGRGDVLGHGHQPEHARHGQHPDADQPGAAVRPHRPAGHRAQPAAGAEQRSGLLRCRAACRVSTPPTSR